jgi:hypothetical protein
MNTAEALEMLGVDKNALTPDHKKSLDEKGYFIYEGFFSKEATDEMRAEF